jgi:phosphocarrier protein
VSDAADHESKGRFEIVNALGLHARAATKLVQLASRFPCEVTVAREEQQANAKSVMGVLLLCASKGTFIDVIAKGDQADDCVKAIGELVANRFGEDR